MVYHEQKEQDWREQAAALQKRLDYYEQENARFNFFFIFCFLLVLVHFPLNLLRRDILL